MGILSLGFQRLRPRCFCPLPMISDGSEGQKKDPGEGKETSPLASHLSEITCPLHPVLTQEPQESGVCKA